MVKMNAINEIAEDNREGRRAREETKAGGEYEDNKRNRSKRTSKGRRGKRTTRKREEPGVE